MIYVLIPIYVIVCVFLILVVLLQQGKGADVASAFGAASSQTTFGARGATTVFERITTWSFVAFSVLAIVISLIQSKPRSSVLATQGKAPATAPKPVVPGPAVPAPVVPAPAGQPATQQALPEGQPAGQAVLEVPVQPATSQPAAAAAAPAPAAPAPATK